MIQHHSDKNLLIIMHYLLDILDVIEVASLNFQKRYGLLMDQTKNLAELTTALAKIGANSGGSYTEQFLKPCECDGEKCTTLQSYERIAQITSKGNVLKDNLKKIPDLSAVSQIIVDKLKAEILDWIPAESMVMYDVLNPFSRPSGTYPFDGYQFRETHLISLYATMFPEEGINLDDSDSSYDEDLHCKTFTLTESGFEQCSFWSPETTLNSLRFVTCVGNAWTEFLY